MTRRAESPFDTYLREIRAYPLLSADEEKALARKIQVASPTHATWGRRTKAAEASPLVALQHMIEEQEAQEARFELTVRNLRLVVSEAKRWASRGLTLPDIVEEGNVGLYHAVELFDPAREIRFSTYATWWIRQAIRRALVNSVRTVRIPRHMSQELARWREWARKFEQREGRAPDADEVAKAMPGSPAKRKILKRVYASVGLTGSTVSLDALFEEDQRIADPRAAAPDDAEFGPSEVERMKAALGMLETREADVLRMRFGLANAEKPLTLREIGRRLSLSRERVRQLERAALDRLRRSLDTDRRNSEGGHARAT
jgi:RNA polymerase primary sigma factor